MSRTAFCHLLDAAMKLPLHSVSSGKTMACHYIIKCILQSMNKVYISLQGSKLRGAEGQNAPKLSPNAPRLLNLGAKFCYPIQPDICFEAPRY